MNIHEYQAKELLKRFGLTVQPGVLCYTGVEAEWAARGFGDGSLSVVKAQVHAGGRGKAGGVKLCRTPEEAKAATEKMIGSSLVTKQTGAVGKKIRKVLVAKALNISKEYYLSLVVNRDTATIGVIASAEGGSEIEELAESRPEAIIKMDIEPAVGYQPYVGRRLANAFGMEGAVAKQLEKCMAGIYEVFVKYDCSMLELNPLVLTTENEIAVIDAKVSFDENALFRHPDILSLRDVNEENERDLEASKFGLNYIALDGDIGCMVNGAGLAMATMDIIKQYGGEPANFLDVGGGASQSAVTNAFRIILQDTSVKGIFVNIFGGIMKCDIIANGIVAASRELGVHVPLVVLLEGTNVEEGKRILNESGLNIVSANSLAHGATSIVNAVKLAKERSAR
jgi:succinyl-CoA synthetase beta subunit